MSETRRGRAQTVRSFGRGRAPMQDTRLPGNVRRDRNGMARSEGAPDTGAATITGRNGAAAHGIASTGPEPTADGLSLTPRGSDWAGPQAHSPYPDTDPG